MELFFNSLRSQRKLIKTSHKAEIPGLHNLCPSSSIRAQSPETSMELGGAKEGPGRENSLSKVNWSCCCWEYCNRLDSSWCWLFISRPDLVNHNSIRAIKQSGEKIESAKTFAFEWLISWCLQINRMRVWGNIRALILIMTLSFSSFSIKDILTGRDARGRYGTRRTEGFCAPKRNICAGYGGTRVPDLPHRDADESRIRPERLPADLSLSAGNLRSDTYSEESRGEQTEHRGGEQ